MFKDVIFDFDGTLVDSRQVFISWFNEMAEKNDYKKIDKINLDDLRKLSIYERCQTLGVPVYKMPSIVLEFYRRYKTAIQSVKLYEGIPRLLDNLSKSGFRISIISSNSEEIIRKYLVDHKIGCIDEILCSSFIFSKDKIIKKYIRSKGLSAADVVYVGDEQRDVIACKKARVRIIWVSWGFDSYESVEKEGPDYIAVKPEEIEKIALGGNN